MHTSQYSFNFSLSFSVTNKQKSVLTHNLVGSELPLIPRIFPDNELNSVHISLLLSDIHCNLLSSALQSQNIENVSLRMIWGLTISFVRVWVLHVPLFDILRIALLIRSVPVFITTVLQISVNLLRTLLPATCSKKSSIRSLCLLKSFGLVYFIWTIRSTLKLQDDKNDKYDGYHSSCNDTNYECRFFSRLRGDVFLTFASRWSWC